MGFIIIIYVSYTIIYVLYTIKIRSGSNCYEFNKQEEKSNL